jgi:hypothetical protein
MPGDSVLFHGCSKKHSSGGNVLGVPKERKELARQSEVRRFEALMETGIRSEEAEHPQLSVAKMSFGRLSQLQ